MSLGSEKDVELCVPPLEKTRFPGHTGDINENTGPQTEFERTPDRGCSQHTDYTVWLQRN